MNLDVWDGILIGIYIGVFIGWWWNRKPPVIQGAKIEANLKIDQSALDKIETARVMAWLEERGMTWMPKGAVFDPDRKIPK